MQPSSILIFLFLYSPEISTKSQAADFGFPFSQVVCNLAEIREEILAEIQKSKLLSAGLDSLKTWAGTGKRKKESDSILQIKQKNKGIPKRQRISLNIRKCLFSWWSCRGHRVLDNVSTIVWILMAWKSYDICKLCSFAIIHCCM